MPYDQPETRKSNRQSKKKSTTVNTDETFSTRSVILDDQIPGPSNVTNTSTVNVPVLNNTDVVSRSEFLQLQSNGEKILLSINQLQTKNAESSFPVEKPDLNVQGVNDGISVTMTQEVDNVGLNTNPTMDEVNLGSTRSSKQWFG